MLSTSFSDFKTERANGTGVLSVLPVSARWLLALPASFSTCPDCLTDIVNLRNPANFQTTPAFQPRLIKPRIPKWIQFCSFCEAELVSEIEPLVALWSQGWPVHHSFLDLEPDCSFFCKISQIFSKTVISTKWSKNSYQTKWAELSAWEWKVWIVNLLKIEPQWILNEWKQYEAA